MDGVQKVKEKNKVIALEQNSVYEDKKDDDEIIQNTKINILKLFGGK